MSIQRALILDTETSGLDDTAQIIEVGAILYSVENQCVLQELSTLFPALKNDAEYVNRIEEARAAYLSKRKDLYGEFA